MNATTEWGRWFRSVVRRTLTFLASLFLLQWAGLNEVMAAEPGASKTVAASSKSSTQVSEPMVIGIAPAFFWETTHRKDVQRVGGQSFGSEREPPELRSIGKFNLQLWFLAPILIQGARLGGGVAWYHDYTLGEVPKDGEKDDPERHRSYGHMFQIWLQPEYVISEVVSKLNILLGVRGGMSLIVQNGDLQKELDKLDEQGFSVSGLPRLGVVVGPHLGVSWPLAPRLTVRSDFSIQFAKTWLYGTESEVLGIVSERSAQLSTTRQQVLLGLEVSL